MVYEILFKNAVFILRKENDDHSNCIVKFHSSDENELCVLARVSCLSTLHVTVLQKRRR